MKSTRTTPAALLGLLVLLTGATLSPAQSCSLETQRNFAGWPSIILDQTEQADVRAIKLTNPESLPIRICELSFPLYDTCLTGQDVRFALRRPGTNGQPTGTQRGLSRVQRITRSPTLYTTNFGGSVVLGVGESVFLTLTYDGACVFGGVRGPIANGGPTVESWRRNNIFGVDIWTRDDVPAIYRMRYELFSRARSETYGIGCSGIPAPPCGTSPLRADNQNPPFEQRALPTGWIAFQVRDNFGYPTRALCAIELETASVTGSDANVQLAIHEDVGGEPGLQLGVTSALAPPGFRSTVRFALPQPVTIGAGRNYWVALRTNGDLRSPETTFGNPVATRSSSDGSTWAPSSNRNWSFRTFTSSGFVARDPMIDVGAPFIGESRSIVLRDAPAGQLATLVLGQGNPNMDLGPLGAPGCFLYTPLDLLLPFQTSGSGFVQVPYQVPNDPALIGSGLNLQWFIFNPASPFGLASSPGVRLTIGTR